MKLALFLFVSFLFISCSQSNLSEETKIDILRKTDLMINEKIIKNRNYLESKYLFDPEKMNPLLDEADSLELFFTSINSLLESLVNIDGKSKNPIELYNQKVRQLNRFVAKSNSYTDYSNELKLESATNLPLDSMTISLLKIENARICKMAIRSIMANMSVSDFSFPIPELLVIKSSDSIIQKGENHKVHLCFGSFQYNFFKIQPTVRVFKNKEPLHSSIWDTTSTSSGKYQLIITPKDTGNYSWEVDYPILRPNGVLDTQKLGATFIVK